MDIRAYEASGGGHLLEGLGEVMGPLMVIVVVVHFEIHLSSHSNEIGFLPEGFPVVLLEDPHQRLPLLAGSLLGSDV